MSEAAGGWTEMEAADGHRFRAWRVAAGGDGGRRGGLVVAQEIFGVNEHIREACERFGPTPLPCAAMRLYSR